jgi:hypothetical protein
VAVLVPAFAPVTTGPPADARTGASGGIVLPVFDFWRFRSGPGGDFLSLAKRLKPGQADPATGRAPVTYARLPGAGPLQARGALAPLGATDAPLPAAVANDLAGLTSPPHDSRGRIVLGLPSYGSAWRDAVRSRAQQRPTASRRGWADTSTLGDTQHQPDGVGGADLVLVVRGQLLLRYGMSWTDLDAAWFKSAPLANVLGLAPLRRYAAKGGSRALKLPLVVPPGLGPKQTVGGQLRALVKAAGEPVVAGRHRAPRDRDSRPQRGQPVAAARHPLRPARDRRRGPGQGR